MNKARREANRILREYGKEQFRSHAAFMGAANVQETSAHWYTVKRCHQRTARRAALVFAILILTMAFTLIVCSALGIQLFNFSFDKEEGFTLLKSLDDKDGDTFYEAQYVPEGYHLDQTIRFTETDLLYLYTSPDGSEEYGIDESLESEEWISVDNERFIETSEIYNEYELIVYFEAETGMRMVFLEKNNTRISIEGKLSMDEVHAIIDSLVPDKDVPDSEVN